MDLHVLNQNFEAIYIVDRYESLIWVDRYYEPGEFEIYTPVTTEIIENLLVNNYIRFSGSQHMMIIEDIHIEADVENGNYIRIKGRSLESILDRRCVVDELTVGGSLQTTIQNIINNNIIAPSDEARKIPNFIFTASEDEAVTSETYENVFEGESILDITQEMCKQKELGFKIILNDNNQFEFSLYKGVDRSYRQEALPWVVFKPSFENIINSIYSEEHNGSKTFCYIHGQYTQNSNEVNVIRTLGSGEGLLRKELYFESGVSKDNDKTLDAWYAEIDQVGREELADHKVKKEFEGELETKNMFVFDRDFFVGDVVQVANEYGMENPARMIEYTWEISTSGINHHPTFEALDYKESEV